LVGGFLASQLLGLDVSGFNLISVVIAFVGACLVIGVSRALTANRAGA